MCDPLQEGWRVQSMVGRGFVEDVFPQYFSPPLHYIQPGKCLACGADLSRAQMFPPGRMPRYMCESCFGRIVSYGAKSGCLTCGQPLPYSQILSQQQNPREVKFALHEGMCTDYHFAAAGIVLGVPFNVKQELLALDRYEADALPGAFQPRALTARGSLPWTPVRDVKYLKHFG